MQGPDVGQLIVEASTNGGQTWTEVSRIIGDQGPNWRHHVVSRPQWALNPDVQFRFIGQTGQGELGDIALDNIVVGPPAGPGQKADVELEDLKVFPNPFTESFRVQTPASGRLELFNTTGKMVYHSDLASGGHEVAPVGLSGGMYILRFGSVSQTGMRQLFKQ